MSAEWARAWPGAVRPFEFGRSAEGRVMRGLLISRSGALTPEALRVRAIPLLMIQGGIRPGESDGKDGGFAALRDLLGDPRRITCCSGSRSCSFRLQYGWARARGDAGAAQSEWSNRDRLAHDGAKHQPQSRLYEGGHPEMRAMLRLIDVWDPLVCADLHVTDGADFEPDISLQVEPLNQGDANLRVSGRQCGTRSSHGSRNSSSWPSTFIRSGQRR